MRHPVFEDDEAVDPASPLLQLHEILERSSLESPLEPISRDLLYRIKAEMVILHSIARAVDTFLNEGLGEEMPARGDDPLYYEVDETEIEELERRLALLGYDVCCDPVASHADLQPPTGRSS